MSDAPEQLDWTTAPMLAKAVPAVPDADGIPGGLQYEPKWDGFRAIVSVSAEGEAGIGSRGGKSLVRYFPELAAAFAEQLPPGIVLDGEIVLRQPSSSDRAGAERLDWEALSARIHPAESRIAKLAVETPASFVAFDLLQLDGRPLLDEPLRTRREALEGALSSARAPLHLSRVTRDAELARRWLAEFEGAGLDGVVAKPLDGVYAPGKRTMLKIKHARTADVVLVGYRVHKSGSGVGSLLLGLYDEAGELRGVGGASAFTNARRLELVEELEPLVRRDEAGGILHAESERTRFSSAKDTSFVPLDPSRVLEVRYDQMEGMRFRHSVQFARWRDDREPRSCTFEQLEVPAAYDLGDVLES